MPSKWLVGEMTGLPDTVLEQFDRWELAGRKFVPIAHDGRANAVRIVRCSSHTADCRDCGYAGQREVHEFEELPDPQLFMYIFQGKLLTWDEYEDVRPTPQKEFEQEGDESLSFEAPPRPRHEPDRTVKTAEEEIKQEARRVIPKMLAFGTEVLDQADVTKKWVRLRGITVYFKKTIFVVNAYLQSIPDAQKTSAQIKLQTYIAAWVKKMGGLPRVARPCELKFSYRPPQNLWNLGITTGDTEQPGDREARQRDFDQQDAEYERRDAYEAYIMTFERFPGLTGREWQAIKLEREGMKTREIASTMGISHDTVAVALRSAEAKWKKMRRKHGGRFGPRELAREMLGLGPDLTRIRTRPEVRQARERASSTLGRQAEAAFCASPIEDREHETGEPDEPAEPGNPGDTDDNEFPEPAKHK